MAIAKGISAKQRKQILDLLGMPKGATITDASAIIPFASLSRFGSGSIQVCVDVPVDEAQMKQFFEIRDAT